MVKLVAENVIALGRGQVRIRRGSMFGGHTLES